MKIGIALQARMGSRRCPGKVLRTIEGRPLLDYALDSLRRCRRTSGLVVATSVGTQDDAVAEYCRSAGVACWRGSEEDVAGRFVEVVQNWNWQGVVRISGDSPLIDHRLVERAVAMLSGGDLDLATNVFPRSFPQGQSVEAIGSAALFKAYERMTTPRRREHVTPLFYEESQAFRIQNFSLPRSVNACKMTVDSPGDLERIGALVRSFTRPHWRYSVDELIKQAERVWSPSTPWGVSEAAA